MTAYTLKPGHPASLRAVVLWALVLLGTIGSPGASAGTATLVGWNNLGMHCTDGSDFSVFSILPHYNTIQAQLMVDGKLVAAPQGMTVTYEAVADPDGSINRTSIGKGNFYQYVQELYGAVLKPDEGLAGSGMPGPQNMPQSMRFDPAMKWFIAEGIPITPFDDAGRKNYYPLMRLTARDSGQRIIATTDIVLPVSDEMTCVVCHGSGKSDAARPAAGWVQLADTDRDYKLNVLRLHDDKHLGKPLYTAALLQGGFSPAGLYRQVIDGGAPILCARCHASEALPGTGLVGVPPLTQAIHARHAGVVDPVTLKRMDDTENRASCYRCHPGSETRCLRGVMGNTVASDGTMAIQCQSCHGSMAAVGRNGRVGWLEEPDCQSCHTGTAVSNNGQIRYTSVFDAPGHVRVAVNRTFATSDNTPAPGVSLYRFSAGHGGLQCSACHGSTHAEFPSSHRNDNLQNLKLQGHVGTLAECSVCHTTLPAKAFNGGPHGMHPVGQAWIEGHKDPAENNLALCRQCHGADLRGTVLSRSSADRSLRTEWGTKTVWRGFQIGCYACHQGPFDDDRNPNLAPVASPASLATPTGSPKSLTLGASDADQNPLVLRIVSQPAHGTVALNGRQATYFPERGFVGTDTFTFAAWDGSTESNLGRVSITVTAGTGLSLHILLELDHVVLSWPTGNAALVVETSDIPATGDWRPLAAEASTNGGTSYLNVPSTNIGQLFRLREP